jgi:hypothetical protein
LVRITVRGHIVFVSLRATPPLSRSPGGLGWVVVDDNIPRATCFFKELLDSFLAMGLPVKLVEESSFGVDGKVAYKCCRFSVDPASLGFNFRGGPNNACLGRLLV